jgi:hypothetical protein
MRLLIRRRRRRVGSERRRKFSGKLFWTGCAVLFPPERLFPDRSVDHTRGDVTVLKVHVLDIEVADTSL